MGYTLTKISLFIIHSDGGSRKLCSSVEFVLHLVVLTPYYFGPLLFFNFKLFLPRFCQYAFQTIK